MNSKHTRDDEFAGKRVLVTGGTKGAGKAIAERFLRGGAAVIITARSVPEGKADSNFIQADLSTTEGTTKVITEILGRFRGIDIMVHNVGGSSAPSGGFMTVTDELWQQAFNENLFPAVRLDRALLPSSEAQESSSTFRRFKEHCRFTIQLSPTRRRRQH